MDNPALKMPVQDERIMAALAHVSALLPFMGVIAPIVIWATQKDKSAYVRFQALQAVAYQLTMILAWVVGMGCYMCSFFLTFGGLAATTSSSSEAVNGPAAFLGILAFAIPFVVFGLIFVGGIAFVLYGLVGAVQTLGGKNFHYIIIGKRVERFLQEGQPRPRGPGADEVS